MSVLVFGLPAAPAFVLVLVGAASVRFGGLG